MADNENLLFVLGAGKTGTTALCGLLNSHPDVFMMSEVYFNNCMVSRWGNRLLKAHPELLPCFFQDFGNDKLDAYRRGARILRAAGHPYRFFGDKYADMNTGYAEPFGDARVIFSVRDLPEWLAKDSIRKWYPIDQNVVPYAAQYSKHFVESFLLPRTFYVRMDDFLSNNAAVTRSVWNFLEMTPPPDAEKWWETIGRYPSGDPKGALNWWRGHGSSAVAPQENDTKVKLRDNPFWNEILPIFRKYYDGVNDRRFERAEIVADLKLLNGMMGRYEEPIERCFTLYDSQSHGPKFRNKPGSRGLKLRGFLRSLGLR